MEAAASAAAWWRPPRRPPARPRRRRREGSCRWRPGAAAGEVMWQERGARPRCRRGRGRRWGGGWGAGWDWGWSGRPWNPAGRRSSVGCDAVDGWMGSRVKTDVTSSERSARVNAAAPLRKPPRRSPLRQHQLATTSPHQRACYTLLLPRVGPASCLVRGGGGGGGRCSKRRRRLPAASDNRVLCVRVVDSLLLMCGLKVLCKTKHIWREEHNKCSVMTLREGSNCLLWSRESAHTLLCVHHRSIHQAQIHPRIIRHVFLGTEAKFDAIRAICASRETADFCEGPPLSSPPIQSIARCVGVPEMEMIASRGFIGGSGARDCSSRKHGTHSSWSTCVLPSYVTNTRPMHLPLAPRLPWDGQRPHPDPRPAAARCRQQRAESSAAAAAAAAADTARPTGDTFLDARRCTTWRTRGLRKRSSTSSWAVVLATSQPKGHLPPPLAPQVVVEVEVDAEAATAAAATAAAAALHACSTPASRSAPTRQWSSCPSNCVVRRLRSPPLLMMMATAATQCCSLLSATTATGGSAPPKTAAAAAPCWASAPTPAALCVWGATPTHRRRGASPTMRAPTSTGWTTLRASVALATRTRRRGRGRRLLRRLATTPSSTDAPGGIEVCPARPRSPEPAAARQVWGSGGSRCASRRLPKRWASGFGRQFVVVTFSWGACLLFLLDWSRLFLLASAC